MAKIANCAIVGGGISGLCTAYLLSRLPKNIVGQISVFERASNFGGMIKTIQHKQSGSYHDLGPHSVRLGTPSSNVLLRIIQSIGSENEIIWIPPATRFIYAAGKLQPLHFLSPYTNPPFTRSSLGLIVKKLFSPGPKPLALDADMSVDEFLRTRFDNEFADYLGSALVRGITGGDSRKISVTGLLPKITHWDRAGPNLLLGAAKSMFNDYFQSPHHLLPKSIDALLPPITKIPKNVSVMSLKKGMQTLTSILLQHLRISPNVHLYADTQVESVNYKNGAFELTAFARDKNSSQQHTSDSTFLCLPASSCGAILQKSNFLSERSEAANLLHSNSLPYSDIATICFEFNSKLNCPSNAFGHLVPRLVDDTVLGVVYDSQLFPHLDGKYKTTRLTVMILPKQEWLTPETLASPFNLVPSIQNELMAIGLKTLQSHLNLDVGKPDSFTTGIWSQCIPNYPINHVSHVRKIRKHLEELVNSYSTDGRQTLHLVGSSFDGVGVGDCVMSAAKEVAAFQDKVNFL